ncbi:MAG TPA: DNA-binding protein [Candidatus Thermoplasmatota archaeon]|nr:DNA-binding protein [Candidatus Thermoplasmatota archaeon]
MPPRQPGTSDLPKLAAPAQRALAAAGVARLADLARMTQAEVEELHGIGPNAMKSLLAAFRAKGLSFKVEKR